MRETECHSFQECAEHQRVGEERGGKGEIEDRVVSAWVDLDESSRT